MVTECGSFEYLVEERKRILQFKQDISGSWDTPDSCRQNRRQPLCLSNSAESAEKPLRATLLAELPAHFVSAEPFLTNVFGDKRRKC